MNRALRMGASRLVSRVHKALAAWMGLMMGWGLMGGEWNQWRGPGRDGSVSPSPEWPALLDEDHLTPRWRVELGPGYSGPLVDERRVYVTESRDEAVESVLALDRMNGRELWRSTWEGYLKVPFFARANGNWIRSTPALAGGRLYVGGMRDVLVCLEAATGKEVWRLDFPVQMGQPLPGFGFVSSPLVVGDGVYVQAGAGLVRVEADTGRVVWQALQDAGGMWGSAFASPAMARLGERDQLLVQTREMLAGVDPENGVVFWKQPIEAFRGMNILTPVVVEGRLFTSAYGGKTQGWTVAARSGDAWEVREDWSLRLEGYMTTPVVWEGHAYLLARNQRLVCVEVATGKQRWESPQKFGKYMSLVRQGGRILGLDQRGLLYVFEADPTEYRAPLERRVADAESWAHVAVEGNDLVIREQEAVAMWDWRSPGMR